MRSSAVPKLDSVSALRAATLVRSGYAVVGDGIVVSLEHDWISISFPYNCSPIEYDICAGVGVNINLEFGGVAIDVLVADKNLGCVIKSGGECYLNSCWYPG